MRMGMLIGSNDPDELVRKAQDLEARGFDSVWVANFVGHGLEAMQAMNLIARGTDRIKLGTAVVPIPHFHPVALAHQAVSLQKIAEGRFTLGIGLSHPFIVEEWLGLTYEKPATRMREYLSILRPLLNGESAQFTGEFYSADATINLTDVQPVPVVLGAMGPKMLRLAGEMADGTVTYLTGPKTIATHIVPRISAAAAEAGRPAPRVIAGGLPIALVDDVDRARRAVDEQYAAYRNLPSYRAMFDREGVAGAGDIAMLGNAAALQEGLNHLAKIGVTEFMAGPVPAGEDAVDRTVEFLTMQLAK